MTRDTGPARLPALSAPRTNDPALQRWIDAVCERLEVREGARGNAAERVVTQRELDALRRELGGVLTLAKPQSLAADQVAVTLAPGLTAAVSVNQFTDALRSTQLYRDLQYRLDDSGRFERLAVELQSELTKSLTDEAAKRQADVSSTELKIQSAERSFAAKINEVTAAVSNTSSAVQQVSSAYATSTRAQAVQLTRLSTSLGNYYQDGTAGRANLEQYLLAEADKTTGLRAQYTLKVSAGGAVAGFGLAATEVNGTPSSAFIIQADKFAIVSSTYTGGATTSPPTANVPFGVDASGVYINGNVRINAQPKGISLAASSYAYNGSTATPASITITATLNGGLSGTVTFTTTGGTLSGTGNTRTLSMSGVTGPVTVTASVTDSFGTYTQQVGIAYVTNGAAGATGATGATGAAGTRGSVTTYATGSAWSDTTANSAILSATGSSTRVIGDTVTISNGSSFAATKYWSGTAWVDPGVVIDGNLLVNGTLSASKIGAGTLSANNVIFSSTAGTVAFGSYIGGSAAYTGLKATVGSSNWGFWTDGAAYIGTYLFSGPLLAESGSSLAAVRGSAQGTGEGVLGYVAASNNASTSHGVRGQHYRLGTSGLIGASNGYDFYADGTGVNYGPFTGSHDALMHVDDAAEEGDILVDTGLCVKGSLSNVITQVTRSTLPNQKSAVGVFVINNGLLADTYTPIAMYLHNDAFYDFKDTHNYVVMNSLGEGQINVCGKGGNIEVGDLIVTSSIPGKGMKQADDIVRSYTVAKAREAVTFTSPTEVKMVACIYLAG